MGLIKQNLLEIVKKRTAFLERLHENVEKRNQRIEKLKNRNWHIDEASPVYKESYTK